MMPELGHYALVLALALGLVQSVAPIIGARTHDAALIRLANSTALMQFAFVAVSFAALVICKMLFDFQSFASFINTRRRILWATNFKLLGETTRGRIMCCSSSSRLLGYFV